MYVTECGKRVEVDPYLVPQRIKEGWNDTGMKLVGHRNGRIYTRLRNKPMYFGGPIEQVRQYAVVFTHDMCNFPPMYRVTLSR